MLGTVSMSSCGAGGGGDLRTGGGEVGRKETDRRTDRQTDKSVELNADVW